MSVLKNAAAELSAQGQQTGLTFRRSTTTIKLSRILNNTNAANSKTHGPQPTIYKIWNHKIITIGLCYRAKLQLDKGIKNYMIMIGLLLIGCISII